MTAGGSLEGRTALVTAASRGIGRAIAMELAVNGGRLAICSNDPGAIQEAARAIRKASGREVYAEAADLGDEEASRRFARNAATEVGDIDIFVSNSPPLPPGPFRSLSTQGLRRALELGFMGMAAITEEVLPGMLARGHGRLVFVGSGAAIRPIPQICASNVVRSAVHGFCRSLVNEVGHEGVTCNTIVVGNVDTERHRDLLRRRAEAAGMDDEAFRHKDVRRSPLGRYGEPADVARAVAFLASEGAGFIHGAMLTVDGGWTEIPPTVE